MTLSVETGVSLVPGIAVVEPSIEESTDETTDANTVPHLGTIILNPTIVTPIININFNFSPGTRIYVLNRSLLGATISAGGKTVLGTVTAILTNTIRTFTWLPDGSIFAG